LGFWANTAKENGEVVDAALHEMKATLREESSWEAERPATVSSRNSATLTPPIAGPPVAALESQELEQRVAALVAGLKTATERTAMFSKELEQLMEGRVDAFRTDPRVLLSEVSSDLRSASDELQRLHREHKSLMASVRAEMVVVETRVGSLRNELESIRSGRDAWVAVDPMQRFQETVGDVGVASARMEVLKRALRTLESVPAPQRGFHAFNGLFQGSVSAGVPGVVNAYFDAGVRVGAVDEETGHRPVYPFSMVGASTPIAGASYVASTEPGRSGGGLSVNVIPFVGVGSSAASGRFAGVSVPGLFGAGIRERGEIAVSVNVPVGPVMRVGVVAGAGHPVLAAPTRAAFARADRASMRVQEWAARLSLWVRNRVSPPDLSG
jgi:hypothetical protein